MRRVKSFWKKDSGKSSINGKGSRSRVFGVPLDALNPQIPDIIKLTTQYIEEYGLNEHGLFRVPGHYADVNALKASFEKNEYIDLSLTNPHAVTGVLKQYLRDLPEPLFTFNSYEALIVSHGVTDPEMRLSCIKSIIEKIPPHYFIVLDYLLAFLHRICRHSKVHKMDSSNLAIIFAPNLLKSKTETAEQIVNDSPRSTSILKFIIDNYAEIFERDPMTGEDIQVKPMKPFFTDDYLLPNKYETINLDKEIAAIFEEEIEGDLSRSGSAEDSTKSTQQQSQQQSQQLPNSRHPTVFEIFPANGGQYPTSANTLKSSMDDVDPPSQYIDDESVKPSSLLPSHQNVRLSIISNASTLDHDSSISSPDISLDSDSDEMGSADHLNRSITGTEKPSQSQLSEASNANGNNTLRVSHRITNSTSNSNIDIKITGIKNLIDESIDKLENEFLQLAEDLELKLTFQEVLLIASSMKNVMNILKEGPDVDTKVVSSFELDISAESEQQQMKRIETLKKAILSHVTNSIPQLLLQIREESKLLSTQEDIEREICLVELIRIMRTLKAVNNVLDFFYSRWDQISPPPSPIHLSTSPIHGESSSVTKSALSSPLVLGINSMINGINNNGPPSPLSKHLLSPRFNQYNGANQLTTSGGASKNGISLTSSGVTFREEKVDIKLVMTKLEDTDQVLFETEESLMTITSKSELIFIAKVIQNLQKIILSPLSCPSQFDDIPPPKINTLKITPKQKLAPLISVVYVLIKEIRDQIKTVRLDLETNFNTKDSPDKEDLDKETQSQINAHYQRVVDLGKLIVRLPMYQVYKERHQQRQAAALKNCNYMRESIRVTINRLKPLFVTVKADTLRPDITLDNLMKISRSVTKIKKLFDDPKIIQKTGIKFKVGAHLLAKSNPSQLTLSNENLNSQTISEKVTTLRALSGVLTDSIISKFDILENSYSNINQEVELFEIISLLKNVIELIKEIK
eukprot:gene634-787_t